MSLLKPSPLTLLTSMKAIFFDIETGPHAGRIRAYIDQFDPFIPPAEPPAEFDIDSVKVDDLKMPHAITRRQDKAREEWEHLRENYPAVVAQAQQDHYDKHADRAALDPTLAEILVITYMPHEHDHPTLLVGSEAQIIREFYDVLRERSDHTLVNWTGSKDDSNFDRMMLNRRGLTHRIKVPKEHPRVLDLSTLILKYDKFPGQCSLDKIAFEQQLGFDELKNEVTGKHFWRYFSGTAESKLTAEEQMVAAQDYAKRDVYLLRELSNVLTGTPA